MKQCWRWFGPADKIALPDLHQVGVQGIVSALHDILPGALWTPEAIRQRQDMLHQQGFDWTVVESLPVSESIKTQSPQMADHLLAYKKSLRNLAAAGISTICYNFMPILDWTRTELRAKQPHGGTAMLFCFLDFAVFDLHILQRDGATADYSQELQEMAAQRFADLTDAQRVALQNNIVAGLPGSNDKWTTDDVRAHLATYQDISPTQLRQNLIDFLSEVCPVAEELGLRLCCHPDDPPFSLLGLPRIMSSTDDYAHILDAVPSPANGATLCTGSLGVAEGFDPVEFVSRLGDKIHFVHLRNTKRLPGSDRARPDFFEAAHLEGDTDMVATIKALLAEEQRRKAAGRADWEIPMRPDHGQELLSDLGGDSMPGYPLIGRMRGLAELRGIMAAFDAA
ncbi:mannonate dehydratase [Roseobacter denitrificans]|uniref:Mannonate dehydratase n=1 Tax=Roseobacter denitrificans (strain ATCC 33942 / OCh 114) TaxID=375451 RepID=Q16CD0_ROSDO|nr:mannonate dehydratase [Roseobacter denitrificans]ABG30363.1 mannonate dehydratase [Roseobacter denitrificans OCh 114]AVL54941.1 mannonate dehydratase [Roseobacter denitrificans]SFF71981.1 D-mannonate dehydratase [Roseobacter denitrificans OCh 114]